MTRLQPWRLLDMGLLPAADNIAVNQSILSCQQQDRSPATLRFVRFPPTALLGCHQNPFQELHLDYCRENNVQIQRRLTGGGAVYVDGQQLGWELYFPARWLNTQNMAIITQKLCETAARAISALGVDAQFRPRNDIEVAGKKISGTGGVVDGGSILFQGSLLLSFDPERMLSVLNIPIEKISDKAIASASERLTSLSDLLGEIPPIAIVQRQLAEHFAKLFDVDEWAYSTTLNPCETAFFPHAIQSVTSPTWVYPSHQAAMEIKTQEALLKTPGGLIRVRLLLDEKKLRICQLWISGDFSIQPVRRVMDLEGYLRNTAVSDIEENILQFFQNYPAQLMLMKPEYFVQAVKKALDAGC